MLLLVFIQISVFPLVGHTAGTVVDWGRNTSGQTTISARLTDVVAMPGRYAHSLTLSAILNVQPLPVISEQPADQRVNPGTDVTLFIVASGTGSLSYQWQHNGSNIDGATASTLVLTNVQLAQAGLYRVLVTDNVGTQASRDALIYVLVRPTIVQQPSPANQISSVGEDVTITADATGAQPMLCRWRRNGVTVAFESPLTLTLTGVTLANAGYYDVVVTNLAGGTTPAISSRSYLSIVAPPVSQIVALGNNATFRAVLTSAGPLTNRFWWLYNGTTVLREGTNATPSSNPVTFTNDLILAGATPAQAGSYTFMVSNALVVTNITSTNLVSATKACTASLVVGGAAPTITSQPQSQTVVVGSSVTFSVSANGTLPLSYQWRKGTNTLVEGTNSTYTIASTVATDAGDYDVVVSNAFGSDTSAVAVLTVVFPPYITVQPVSYTVLSGSFVTLSVVAGGAEPLSFQWRNQAGIIPGATNASYVLDPALTTHAGNYAVVVTNLHGAVTSSVATVIVFIPVAITAPPLTQVVAAGGTATFQVSATGYPAPSYQWLFMGEARAGASASSLVITNVGTNSLGEYRVAVWNAYSAATSSPALLLMSPSLRSPFVGTTAIWGKAATLSVYALGSGPLSYQWFKDGMPVSGATNEMLAFSAVQISDGGLYSVVVSSLWGSVTNAPAQLVVNPANIALGLYGGVTIGGVPGYTYGIQYTTDLRDTNSWVTATNLTLSEPVELWVDKSVDIHSTGTAKRYYRVVGQ